MVYLLCIAFMVLLENAGLLVPLGWFFLKYEVPMMNELPLNQYKIQQEKKEESTTNISEQK